MSNAVIFDMDGLLIDTEPLWDKVDQQLLKKRRHIFTNEIRKQRVGIGQHATVELFIKRYKLTDKPAALINERQNRFAKLFKNPVPMKGAVKIIKLLFSMDLKLGIATGGYNEKGAKSTLRHLKVEKFFHSITTSHEVKNGKPSPDIYLLEAKKLNNKPSNCLVLEDVPAGIQSAKSAGMKVIAVNDTDLYQPKDFKSADLFVHSLEEINRKTIEKLLEN